METFLVECLVEIRFYESEQVDKFTKYHLVSAEDADAAELKAEKFYTDKTSEYSVYYSCYAYVSENIA